MAQRKQTLPPTPAPTYPFLGRAAVNRLLASLLRYLGSHGNRFSSPFLSYSYSIERESNERDRFSESQQSHWFAIPRLRLRTGGEKKKQEKEKKGKERKREGRRKGETMARCFLVSDVASSRRLVVGCSPRERKKRPRRGRGSRRER